MTNEQISAFAAFGLMVADRRNYSEILEYLTREELNNLAEDAEKYLSPLVGDSDDMVSPVVAVLREAIEEAKNNV
jgi:hypothetical protein